MAESLILDGLDLNASPYLLFSIDHTPAPKRPEWAEAVDGDGALLVRDPHFANCQWDVVVEIRAASRDAAHTAAGSLTAKLEEAERNTLGIPLVWTPDNSTSSLTWYVLTGELKVPTSIETGYLANPPVLQAQLSLTCRPFGYAAEVAVAAAAGSGPLQIFSVAGVAGDVDAEARLVVTDTAGVSRDFCAWGLESRFQTGADLELRQNELTATGFAGTSTTRSGSVSTNVFRGTLTTTPVAVCGTSNQPHIGTFRVKARLYATGTGVRVRLAYRDGDGPLKALLWETPAAEDAWVELDLGLVTVSPKLLGTQRWVGQLEAYTDTVGDTVDVDYLILMPAGEGYGRARRALKFTSSSVFSARDEFDQSAGNLGGKVAPVGGTWATSGSATDFSVTGSGLVTRSTGPGSSSRDASLPVSLTNVEAQVDIHRSAAAACRQGVYARYVNATNNVLVDIAGKSDGTPFGLLKISKLVAGVETMLDTVTVPWAVDSWYTIRIRVDTSGRVCAGFAPQGSAPGDPLLSIQHADLATGGALASGGVGIWDFASLITAATRSFDNVAAWDPAADAVCFAGQSIEFRSDDTIREDATGTYWGVPQEYRGAPFFLPPAGDEGRTSRVAVMLRDNDPYTLPNATVTRNQSVEVRYVPRFLYLPR